jgi:hypothetical protein
VDDATVPEEQKDAAAAQLSTIEYPKAQTLRPTRQLKLPCHKTNPPTPHHL